MVTHEKEKVRRSRLHPLMIDKETYHAQVSAIILLIASNT